MARAKPKAEQYWVVRIDSLKNAKEIVYVSSLNVYPCGDEQGFPIERVVEWVRQIRL